MKNFIAYIILLTIIFLAGCGAAIDSGNDVVPESTASSDATNEEQQVEQNEEQQVDPVDSGLSTTKTIVKWDPPADIDINSIGGYKIYYGTSPGNYTGSKDVGKVTECAVTSEDENVTYCTTDNLSAGTYYFVITVYDTSGYESGYSNEKSKTIY